MRATLLLEGEAVRTCYFCHEQSTASVAGARDWTWVPGKGGHGRDQCPGCQPKKVDPKAKGF